LGDRARLGPCARDRMALLRGGGRSRRAGADDPRRDAAPACGVVPLIRRAHSLRQGARGARRGLRPICLLVAALLLAMPVASHADMSVYGKTLQAPGIKGDDNRVQVDVTRHPWRTIGRLN